MGCGVSMPETEEGGRRGGGGGEGGGGDLKMKMEQGSVGKGSDSFILDKEFLEMSSVHSKQSKSNDEEDETEEKAGDRLIFSPHSPSFRIYCAFPRNPNDKNIVDDHELVLHNKSIADNNKSKGKRQEAVRTRMRKRFYNVKKKLTYPSQPSSKLSL